MVACCYKLIRLGKITEQDVRSTFAAFRKLDLDNDGRLTSKEIILSAVRVEEERKRAKTREDMNNSAVSKSPERRSFLMNSIQSTPMSDITDQQRIKNVDATLAERKFLLPRMDPSQQQKYVTNSEEEIHLSLDYGCIDSSGDRDAEDIEACKSQKRATGRNQLFAPIAPG